jgi:hypothetical protein
VVPLVSVKNHYIIEGNTVRIELKSACGHDGWAIIDLADFPLVNRFRGTWVPQRNKDRIYAVGGNPRYHLSRVIYFGDYEKSLGAGNTTRMVVDHQNNDSLDNRRENLRHVSRHINGVNQKFQSRNKSGYRGVSWRKDHLRWQSVARVNGKNISLGEYKDITLAAEAVKKFWESRGLLAEYQTSVTC